MSVIKKIKLIGWYGYGAHGDDLLALIMKKAIDDCARQKGVEIIWTDDEKECDAFVVGGGTIVGHDSMHTRNILSENQDAPVFVLGPGFRNSTRFLTEEQKESMRILFGRARIKGVRGPLSQQLFLQNDIEETDVIGDPAFLFQSVPIDFSGAGYNVGVSVRSMGKTGEYQYTDNDHVAQCVAQVCDWLCGEKDAQLHFFNFAENEHDSDSEGIKRILSLMTVSPEYEIVPFDQSPEHLFSLVGKMDYFVSQRLHPSILAWIQGVPHVALDYQFGKTDDFMQSIGMREFAVRTDAFSMDVYKKLFSVLEYNCEQLNEQVALSVRYYQRKCYRYIDQMLTELREGIYGVSV